MKSHSVNSSGERFDLYLINLLPDISRSKIQSLIKSNQILINGKSSKSSYILKGSEIISYEEGSILVDDNKDNSVLEEDIKLDILYEDENIIVVNKQSGLVVHPGAGNWTGTLLNGLISKIDSKSFKSNPGIVHRLDKETSGVMIVSKNHSAHNFISKQFEMREVRKVYNALVWGRIEGNGIIEGNIIRNSRNRKIFTITDGEGRYSKTSYKSLDTFGPFSLIELYPETGRTHQIRVHMKSVGHPIVSDVAYSGGDFMIKSFHIKYLYSIKSVLKLINRVALHASSIEFVNPTTMEREKYSSPLSDDMHSAIKFLNNNELL